MQKGGGGIPFSAMEEIQKKNKRNKTIKRKNKTSRSPSRKRKRTRRTKRGSINKKTKIKKCKCGTHKFTGNETTPRGLGKCEECIPLNVIMKGKDGHLYENKNYQWIKFN